MNFRTKGLYLCGQCLNKVLECRHDRPFNITAKPNTFLPNSMIKVASQGI